MKFLVDAQLPKRVASLLSGLGHDVLHTLELPLGNRTPDSVLRRISMSDKRIVMTKDSDFVDSFILQGEPYALLWLTTGNVSNDVLCDRLKAIASLLELVFQSARYVELNREQLVVHQ